MQNWNKTLESPLKGNGELNVTDELRMESRKIKPTKDRKVGFTHTRAREPVYDLDGDLTLQHKMYQEPDLTPDIDDINIEPEDHSNEM